MKKRIVISLALFLLFSTYKTQNLPFSSKFNIKEIKIENNLIVESNEIKKDLTFLYRTNLINININKIENELKKISFIKSFEIKKIYPNKLKIKIFEKKPIAILQYKKEKFYISENIELINYKDLKQFQDLPLVFGKKENFHILFKNLKKTNFPLSLIKKFYLYESNRWDIEVHENIIIKLPSEKYNQSLENFLSIRTKNNFDKYKIFDYRINNQLTLK
jgi:cell division septal protein FtsQ